MTDPSTEAPPKRPFVRLYEYMAATPPFAERAPVPSTFLPSGPAAIAMLPPRVRLPAAMKLLTAARELRMMRNSASSTPTWRPKPAPAVPTAEGADQVPSSRRAMTTPVPARPLKRKPALATERRQKPFALRRTEAGTTLSRPLTAAWMRARVSEGRMDPKERETRWREGCRGSGDEGEGRGKGD